MLRSEENYILNSTSIGWIRFPALFVKLFDIVIDIVQHIVLYWLKLFTELFMTLPHIVQYCSKYSSMSDISLLMPASKPLPHYFARALFRIAMARRFLAALLPKPTLASSSARSSMITANSCSTLLSRMSRFSCFFYFTAWRAWSARDTE